jgi:D-alanyl-D-alanine dipeptidase
LGSENAISYLVKVSMVMTFFSRIITLCCLFFLVHKTAYCQNGARAFVLLRDSIPDIVLDIKYATADNFTGKVIYDCAACYVRPPVAHALRAVQAQLKLRRYRLKMFDCYRPAPFQQRLWEAKPDAQYVTPPQKGSMHSRGYAVDLTIIDDTGNELDMGTPYDDLSVASHFEYAGLTPVQKCNRLLLRKMMQDAGFIAIRTEWWHFSLPAKGALVSEWRWKCGDK